jgi:hypothetical protein
MGGYKIDFIGLVCFVDRGDTRLAYFPDGTNMPGIPVHDARITVPSSTPGGEPSVLDADWGGWLDHDDSRIRIFGVQESVDLEISGLDGSGVDALLHDQLTPPLSADNSLLVDEENAITIARLTIKAGTLAALEFEDSMVSQLTVPHDREIKITATSRVDGTVRTIVLRPGTEIVIRNTSDDLTGGQDEAAHFRIYGQLAPNRVGVLSIPTTDFDALPDLHSDHPDLRPNLGGFGGRNCSNVRAR